MSPSHHQEPCTLWKGGKRLSGARAERRAWPSGSRSGLVSQENTRALPSVITVVAAVCRAPPVSHTLSAVLLLHVSLHKPARGGFL